jgi:RNA polymerase sigma factor FliA
MGAESENFVQTYDGLVRTIAKKTLDQLDLSCELDDLVGYGFRGLLEAKDRFDPSKGVEFQAYAYYRIRGAILDGVRKMAYLPRRAHARMQVARALDTECETAGEIRAANPQTRSDVDESVRMIDAILGRVAVAFAVSTASFDEKNREYQSETDPETLFIDDEQRKAIHQAVEKLPERERLVIQGFYVNNRTLDEIGKELGMSKSWACRTHAKALDRLRETIADPL